MRTADVQQRADDEGRHVEHVAHRAETTDAMRRIKRLARQVGLLIRAELLPEAFATSQAIEAEADRRLTQLGATS